LVCRLRAIREIERGTRHQRIDKTVPVTTTIVACPTISSSRALSLAPWYVRDNFDTRHLRTPPSRQMSFLARMHELIGHQSQFIIATHSPIIVSYPDAWIYAIGPKGLDRVAYEDTEHFQVTRDFLKSTEADARCASRKE
jgi:hypothetical protein